MKLHGLLRLLTFGFIVCTLSIYSANNGIIDSYECKLADTTTIVATIQTETLLAGSQAPDFKMLAPDGKSITLTDFSGKFLLIEVWSTKCGPCLKEIEHVEAFRKEVENKNISVIAACLSDEKSWLNILNNKNLKNGQYRVENGWKSSFRDEYMKASSFPLFILIDPKGKIVNANLPRPSRGLLAEIEKIPEL